MAAAAPPRKVSAAAQPVEEEEDGEGEEWEYEEGEGEGEGEGEEEEEEEEAEPKLKYQRLGSSLSEILSRDAASCLAVHDRFLALGTHWGVVHVLDFNGNEIRKFPVHTATVNELSIDQDGEYVASCSDDGKVVITAIFQSETLEYVYHRPAKAVSLDPTFTRKDNRSFCTGGLAGQVILNRKGWFSSKDTVLHSGEGPITTVKWRGSIIAWANDVGVKMYDCRTNQRITFIDRPKGSPRADLYRCCLCWESDNVLLIGWADSVKICQIKEKEKSDMGAGLPARFVEIVGLFQTDFYISGIAPFKDDLVLLSFVEEKDGDGKPVNKAPCRPELRVVTKQNVEISSDALSVNGWEHYHANDYRLEHLPSESLFYVVSPKDIVVARPRDLDDHISWLLQHEQFLEALEKTEANEQLLKVHKVDTVGTVVLQHLIETGEIEQAARMCPRVLKQDVQKWEKWIFVFSTAGKLPVIVPFIPIRKPQLSKTVYEMVLNTFINNDSAGLLKTLREWGNESDLYELPNVIKAVEERRAQVPADEVLLDVLALLHTFEHKYDKALKIYLKLKRDDVFPLIERYQLFSAIQDSVQPMLDFNKERSLEMLVEHTNEIPIATVVNQLAKRRDLQYEYLHAIFMKDSAKETKDNRDTKLGSDFHDLQVTLYAEFNPKQLLPFLRTSNFYSLDKAYEVCKARNLYREMVHLLGNMGNNKHALELIITQLKDVKEAIAFVESQKDAELWEDLIDKSINNPAFVGGLLENIGSHVDPIKMIKRIPDEMEIPGLRDKLVKIITDYNLQMSLREGCRNILIHDCVVLQRRLYAWQRKGVQVNDATKCARCANDIIVQKDRNDLVAFFCGHVYHQSCIQQNAGGGPDEGAGAGAALPLGEDGVARPQLMCSICTNSDQRQRKGAKAAARGR